MVIVDKIALALVIIGGLNWGSIGIFQFDFVGFICGGSDSVLSRIIFTLVCIAAIWCISILFRSDNVDENAIDDSSHYTY